MARIRSHSSLFILLPAVALASWLVFPPSARSGEADDLTKTVLEQYAAGKYQSAIPLAQRALELEEKEWGPDHPNVATALNNLATLYRYDGQLALAESLYRRALIIDERAFGPAHAQVARDLSNLASLYASQKRYADAEPLYKWALATDEKALGPDHPDVATDRRNLASLRVVHERGLTPSPAPPLDEPSARVGPVATGAQSPAPANTRVLAPSSGQPLSCEAGGAGSSRAIEDFLPWPPPKGSDAEDITTVVRNAIGKKKDVRLRDVNALLSQRLSSVNLPPLAFFSTPERNGYAAVTRAEPIDVNGREIDGDASQSGNLLWRFFNGLVTLPEGHYRLLAVFVTPEPLDTEYSPEPVTIEVTKRWISKGCDGLPTELAELSFTGNYRVFLRVYQIDSRGADSHLVGKADAIPLSKELFALGLQPDDKK
jgi:hypothetical protein